MYATKKIPGYLICGKRRILKDIYYLCCRYLKTNFKHVTY